MPDYKITYKDGTSEVKWFSKKEFLDNYVKNKNVVNVKNLNNPVVTKKTFNPNEYS